MLSSHTISLPMFPCLSEVQETENSLCCCGEPTDDGCFYIDTKSENREDFSCCDSSPIFVSTLESDVKVSY